MSFIQKIKDRFFPPTTPSKERFYGGDGTIHNTTHVDVEVDKRGHVVAVWFRCEPLRYRQVVVDDQRAGNMRDMYSNPASNFPLLEGVRLRYPDGQ